jgi:DNA (cytosine-5)-methyltransferase 1
MKRRKIKKTEACFRFADLFAGIGGFRIALESQGGNCVFSSEWDPFARRTYEANFGEKPLGDITKISVDKIPEIDLLAAGFPCQPFSSIGKREGFEHRTQGTLFFDVLRIVKARRPASLLLENVTGLLSHNGGDTMSTILESLHEAEYRVFHRVLNSANYGVPQHRHRVYIVAFDKRQVPSTDFLWPRPSKQMKGIGQFVESNISGYSISRHLQRVYIYKANDGHPEIITRSSNHPVKTLVASYHKIQRITGTFVKDGPTKLRLLTPSECKAIMGFPKDFNLSVSRTQMYRQMGNSVAIPVVKKVAVNIISSLVNVGVLSRKSPNRPTAK